MKELAHNNSSVQGNGCVKTGLHCSRFYGCLGKSSCAKIEYSLFRNAFDILQNDNDTDTIVYTSAEFQPYANTFSEKYEFIGPSIRESYDTIIKEKEKLVFISLGTVTNDSLTFYRNCLKACANEDYQVIMSVGNRINMKDLGEIPENVSVCTYVDQIAVLKVADIFISHCGMNSVNESLYYGVPLIMHPQTAEQTGVAKRVYQLGAGVFLKKEDKNAINQAIREVLENPEYKKHALEISGNFRKCEGAKAAADKIVRAGNLKQ